MADKDITESVASALPRDTPEFASENTQVRARTSRPVTTLSAIGNGYGTTNTAVGILLVLGTTLPMGGGPLLLWGFILMTIVGLCTAVTLAELCSAMPHPGGQYIWVNTLAPARSKRFLSYVTAMTSWIAAIILSASATLSVILGIVSLVVLLEPSFVYRRWMGFIGFQVLNLVTLFGACFKYGQPKISKYMLVFNCATIFVLFVTLFAMARERATADAIFVRTTNATGWPNGLAWMLGLNGINWSYSCLDIATHLAEEIPSPATNIPKALMWTIVVAFFSGMAVILAILCNLPTIDAAANTSAVTILYTITGSKAVAIGLWIPILLITITAVWGVHTWQSRLAWTLSRESAFPMHQYFSKVAPAPFYTPVWSLVGSATGTAILGFLYLGSDVAFNSLAATGLLIQYISYSIPVGLVLVRGRSSFRHGPFWFPKLGLLANVVMLCWIAMAMVLYCFPLYLPVVADQMNYSAVILVIVAILIIATWFSYAKKHYYVITDGLR
jgi:choline transport protein